MFPKKNRANKKAIEDIFKKGRFVNSTNLTLKYMVKNYTLKPVQISFITPKAISKKAVDRNLLRRRGYAVLEKNLTMFPVGFMGAFVFGKKSKDIFGGRKSKTKNPIQNLENEIKSILDKIN